MEPTRDGDDPDDATTEGDDDVDWTHVSELARRIDEVNAIGDDAERLEAAKRLTAQLGRQ